MNDKAERPRLEDYALAARPRPHPEGTDAVDKVGRSICEILNRVSQIDEDNRRLAQQQAEKLSERLRAAEERIRQLETELKSNQDRADRAEQWLYKISQGIEQQFFTRHEGRSADSVPSVSSILRNYSGRK
jgi:hypothetical protein